MRDAINQRWQVAGARAGVCLAILTTALAPLCGAQRASSFGAQLPSSQPAQQKHATPPTAEAAATLRVTTRLVQVNVIVNDKYGNPITGLTKDDFLLVDNKKHREIQVFSGESNRPFEASNAALPPGTITNRPEPQANASVSVTVILLDTLNTEFGEQALAKKQVLKFLDTVQAQDHIALYWLGSGGLGVLHDFSADPAVLRETLAQFKAEASMRLANSSAADPASSNPNSSTPGGQTSSRDAFRRAFAQKVANDASEERVHLTLAALVAIAHHIGSIQGRKNLVWVSGSFPMTLGYDKFDLDWINDTGMRFEAEIARAARALTHENIAVYPVDARGLIGGDGGSAKGDSEFGESHPEFSGDEPLPRRAASSNLDTMKLLAERTGGKAFYGTNDISGAIRHAIDDARVTYTLGFYPQDVKWDGSFHTIGVRVKMPGAQVRARTGYFALPEPTEAPDKSVRAVISQTATAPLEATAIGLRVQLRSSGAESLTAELYFDLHEIAMKQEQGHWTGTIQSALLQLNAQHDIIQASDQTFHLDFPPEMYERLLRDGMMDTRIVHPLPTAAQLCFVVRDVTNGDVGSVFIPIAKYLPAPQ